MPEEMKRLRPSFCLSLAAVVLMTSAALGGLLIPGLYRDAPIIAAQLQGQDLVTLVFALPLLLASLYLARRGSVRAVLTWAGALGYIIYSYVIYAFAVAYNEFFLIYVALLSVSLFALLGLLIGLDVNALADRFKERTPVRTIGIFFVVIAVMLAFLWLSAIVPALLSGTLSNTAEQPNAVYVLDLAFIIPLLIIGAFWLWRHRAWGFILAALLLVKMVTLGLAIIGMTLALVLYALPADPGLAVFFSVMTLASAGLGVRLLVNMDSEA